MSCIICRQDKARALKAEICLACNEALGVFVDEREAQRTAGSLDERAEIVRSLRERAKAHHDAMVAAVHFVQVQKEYDLALLDEAYADWIEGGCK